MEIAFLTPAQSELDEAYSYYESIEKTLGTQFLDEVFRVIKMISLYPTAWPRFSRNTRRCLISKFPYSVIYQIRDDHILIVAIAHLHRKPDYWRNRV